MSRGSARLCVGGSGRSALEAAAPATAQIANVPAASQAGPPKAFARRIGKDQTVGL